MSSIDRPHVIDEGIVIHSLRMTVPEPTFVPPEPPARHARAGLLFGAIMLTAAICLLPTVCLAQAISWVSDNANRKPQRYVGKIVKFHNGGKLGFCSGVLVGKRHVLTAGHCLMDAEAKWKGRPRSEWQPVVIMFTPGQQGRKAPFGSANALTYAISVPYFEGKEKSRDYGVMKLNRPLGEQTGGWAGMAEWPNGWQLKVTVRGYPGAAEWPRRITFEAWNEIGKLSSFYNWHLFWSRKNGPGMGGVSGGPALVGSTVYGIFQGITRKASGPRLTGMRLSNWPLNQIRDWIRRTS